MLKVSIITPLHNKATYVAETIASVQAQAMSDWEMIVVENGSSDDGPEVVRGLAQNEPRIRVVESPRCGPGAARNFGFGIASGEWVLFLDADDLIVPTYLQDAVNRGYEANADIVVSRWRRFGETLMEATVEERPSCEGRTHMQLLDSAIAFTPWIVHAALVKRSVITPDLLWPEDMDRYLGEDTVFWFRLLCSNPSWTCNPVAAALYRWKVSNCRTQNEDVEKWFEGLHHGASRNVRYVGERNSVPTAAQGENLMRLYEGLYLMAQKAGNLSVADEASALAKKWLRYCLPSAYFRPPLLARYAVGFRIFNVIKRCARSAN